MCFLCLTTVIAGIYGIFIGIEENKPITYWYLLVGVAVLMVIVLGYIHFRNSLKLDGLKLLCPKTEIVTFTEKEISAN